MLEVDCSRQMEHSEPRTLTEIHLISNVRISSFPCSLGVLHAAVAPLSLSIIGRFSDAGLLE